MGPLNTKLRKLREEKEAKRDPAATALMSRATEELRASRIIDGIVGVGEPAPAFARPGVDGETVRLSALLRRGPAVLSFFRGRW